MGAPTRALHAHTLLRPHAHTQNGVLKLRAALNRYVPAGPLYRLVSLCQYNTSSPMKRSLIFAALFLCAGLSSCQCAEQPDVGPVEGDQESAHRIAPGDAHETYSVT